MGTRITLVNIAFQAYIDTSHKTDLTVLDIRLLNVCAWYGGCSFGDGIVYPLPAKDEDTESLLSSERWERWGERARPFDERESSSYDEL